MKRLLASLTGRIFLASAVLAVLTMSVAMWLVNVSVTSQAERELQRGLEEASTLVEQYRVLSVSQLAQQARLIADLPKFKAAVSLADPPTVAPLAADYRAQINSDLFVVVGASGRVLANDGPPPEPDSQSPNAWPAVAAALKGDETTWFLPRRDSVLQVVTVPIWIDPAAPDMLGTLSVGLALDEEFARQIKRLTDSEIAFGLDGRIRAATMPAEAASQLAPLLGRGAPSRTTLLGEEYVSLVRPLAGNVPGPRPLRQIPSSLGGASSGAPVVLLLRSRSERLRPLRRLHTALGLTVALAVLMATLLGYFVARTITRPLAAITAAMRETASTGDLTRRLSLPESGPWADEDARLLATTFNTMTASIARFQQEAAQRERLSSLGRLSTVIAHEIRNPLMIIKAALRSLRPATSHDPQLAPAVADIDDEVNRLNRLVNDVLDFARPIRFELAPARLTAVCRDAVSAVQAQPEPLICDVRFDHGADEIVTDAERLRQALINLLANARQAVCEAPASDAGQGAAGTGQGAGTGFRQGVGSGFSRVGSAEAGQPRAAVPAAAPAVARIELATAAGPDGSIRITVRDQGPGIGPDLLPRVFDPFFTTKRTGTGIGLAITRNIIDGLGGSIRVRSRLGVGTEMIVELPRTAPASHHLATS